MVTASVIEYFQRMMNAARPFATEHTYAISVCDRFIQGLDRRLLPCFRRMYPAHSTVHNMNGAYQRQQLPVILAAAQAAEDEVKGVQDIARGLLGQGFYSNIIGNDASAYPSQAEKTLSRYGNRRDDRTKGRERRPLECFGCGGDHSWMKDKKIVCPCGTEPAVIKHAAEAYKIYLERVKELRSKRSKGRVVDFKDMAPSNQNRMREAVLASQCNASQASSMTGSSGSFLPGPVVFIVQVPDDAFVLNATAPRQGGSSRYPSNRASPTSHSNSDKFWAAPSASPSAALLIPPQPLTPATCITTQPSPGHTPTPLPLSSARLITTQSF